MPDAEAMRAVDSWAIEQRGVPGIDLMERAGAAVARAVEQLEPDGHVTVVCGKGNNGGDGLVVARLLRHAGRSVTVVCVAPPQELTGDAATNRDRLPGPAPVRLDGTPWEAQAGEPAAGEGIAAGQAPGTDPFATALVVDALLGTGFSGVPRGAVKDAIELIEGCGEPVVAVDVPSGVDASSGAIAGAAVPAASTVSFHAVKPGLWIMPGKERAGAVSVCDIGIPRGAPMAASIGLIEPSVVRELPRRKATGTKFSSGHVLVAGGSRGLSGAPTMTARASMRAGAGYVTVCVPASLQPILAGGGTPELMTRALPEEDGGLTQSAAADVLEVAARGGALALGPGLGRSEGAVEFARELVRRASIALVLDADGLNAHAGRLGDLAARTAPTVLTPHAGELGRLLELDSVEIERERLRYVREAARVAAAVVVLKGDDSLIADPDGRVAVSRGGSPALATAGTGDVLTGVVAALLAAGLDAFTAAASAVWLHAEAGRRAAAIVGSVEGVIATDVIEALPGARGGAGRGRDD
jgi:ADP-dependent NAD(P)H-hydrate dehydratase / NAD(P)H-hydrate epimerase